MNWYIYYRGPLSSCNYGCVYCPFSKRTNTVAELKDDFAKVNRFTHWCLSQERSLRLLFTPWGEALIHSAYQKALIRLSHAANIKEAAIQTNLSGKIDWVTQAKPEKLSLWVTYHPTETDCTQFLRKCSLLHELGISFSVGIVGKREHFDEIERMRELLPADVYLWVNAFNDDPSYYSEHEIKRLSDVDALFPINVQRYPSLGKLCYAGETAFTVDGEGDARRCHFIQSRIGNIYESGFASLLKPSPCINDSCSCHIGYVHLKELNLYERYGARLAGRIPTAFAR